MELDDLLRGKRDCHRLGVRPGSDQDLAGRDDGYFDAAVHIAKKFGFAGWSLDVEPTLSPPGSGANYLSKIVILSRFACCPSR